MRGPRTLCRLQVTASSSDKLNWLLILRQEAAAHALGLIVRLCRASPGASMPSSASSNIFERSKMLLKERRVLRDVEP